MYNKYIVLYTHKQSNKSYLQNRQKYINKTDKSTSFNQETMYVCKISS